MKKLRKYQSFLVVAAVLLAFLSGAFLFLMSEYSLKNLWLPLISSKANVEITAERCSASLFGAKTFSAKNLKVKGRNYSAEASSAALYSSPLDFLFGGVYPIRSLTMTGVVLNIRENSSVRKPDGKKKRREVPGKSDEDFPGMTIPVTVEKLSLSDLTVRFERTGGDSVELREANVEIAQLVPGARSEVSFGGILFCRYGNIRVRDTEISSRLRFTLPEKGIIPGKIGLNLNTNQAFIEAGEFSSAGNTLAVIADLELEKEELRLESCSLSIGNEKGGDILSANFVGNLLEGFDESFLNGTLKLYPSKLTDAVCSNLFGAEIAGLSADGKFNGRIQHGKLHSDAAVSILASSVAPGKIKGQPIRNAEIQAEASLSGSPKNLSFVLEKASLTVRKNDKTVGDASLLAPWDFLEGGKLVAVPLPHAKIKVDQFPLSALIPFGLDSKYGKETVSVSLVSKPGKEEESEVVLDASTSFPVSGIGPLTAHAAFVCSRERVELSESRIFCGTPEKSAAASVTGVMNISPASSLEFDSSFEIRNPERVFKSKAFENIQKINPKISGKCLFGKEYADIWLEAAGGKYRVGLSSKILLPDANEGFWESRGSETGATRLDISAGGDPLLKLLLSFRIPESGPEEMKVDGKTEKISPDAFREIAFLLPDNMNFDKTEADLRFSVREKDGTMKGSLDLLFKQILLKNWEEGKSAPLDSEISASADWKDGGISLKKCRVKASVDKEKTADFNLDGTILPKTDGGKTFSLNLLLERLNLETVRKLAEKISAGMKRKADGGSSVPAAKPAGSVPARDFAFPDISPYSGSVLNFKAKNVVYTHDLIVESRGTVNVKGKTFSLKTDQFTVNRHPGHIALSVETGSGMEHPFTAVVSLEELPLGPVSRAVSGGRETGIGGTLKNMNLNLSGIGFSRELLMRKTQGFLTGDFSALSVPVSAAKETPLGKMILVPLQTLPSIIQNSEKLSQTAIGKNLADIAVQARDILDGKRNLEFSSASGQLVFQPGVLVVKEIRLLDGIVDSEELSGSLVLPDGELRMNSVMQAREFVLPVQVKGTLKKPKIDASGSLKGLLRYNAREMLRKENLEKTVKSVNELIKAFR